MTTKRLLAGGAACCALIVAAPVAAAPRDDAPIPPEGQALSPEVVPGAGLTGVAGAQATIRRVVRGQGLTDAGAARFRIDLAKPAADLSYVDATRHIVFRAVHLDSVRLGPNSAKLRGIGILNQKRVPFTAVAVHNALPSVDVFRISWSRGAGHGGRVSQGSVFIR
jgi:hypothetical protein